MASPFVSLANAPAYALAPGAAARALFGERAMLNLVQMEPGAVVARHSHPHEQLGLVLQGSISMSIGDEQRDLGELEAFVAAPGIEHGGTAGPQGALLLDAFAPVREDYRQAAGG
jgi:quercetin dioxygenase-like cupin family protein